MTRIEAQGKPVIGITMGDPAGVGPELCLRALHSPLVWDVCVPVIFGQTALLRRVAEACRLPPPPPAWPEGWHGAPPTGPAVVEATTLAAAEIVPGRVQRAGGQAAYEALTAAVAAAQQGWIAGIATAPLHKEALHLAGHAFPGHTELLQELTGAPRVCMMLASDVITVSLVTTHIALADVPRQLSPTRLADTIALTAAAMRRIGRCPPRLTVCALNPHAGEHGLFGDEEARLIEPVLAACRSDGLDLVGPLPPDTAFLPERLATTDAYIVMYHDQGLIPFKMLAFDRGVNVTLGLPIVRTSVDHGTAFDIAWQGRASATSLVESIRWAVRLACPESGGASTCSGKPA